MIHFRIQRLTRLVGQICPSCFSSLSATRMVMTL
jgi:hypothetical protein